MCRIKKNECDMCQNSCQYYILLHKKECESENFVLLIRILNYECRGSYVGQILLAKEEKKFHPINISGSGTLGQKVNGLGFSFTSLLRTSR